MSRSFLFLLLAGIAPSVVRAEILELSECEGTMELSLDASNGDMLVTLERVEDCSVFNQLQIAPSGVILAARSVELQKDPKDPERYSGRFVYPKDWVKPGSAMELEVRSAKNLKVRDTFRFH